MRVAARRGGCSTGILVRMVRRIFLLRMVRRDCSTRLSGNRLSTGAYEDDPAIAASEWGGQFRSDLESYVSPEIVDACTARGVTGRPYFAGHNYFAHADPAGGGADSFTLAIGHREDDVAIIDQLLESRSRKPLDTISEFAAVLQSLWFVGSDRGQVRGGVCC